MKKYQKAIDVLSELKVAGHQDPETLGILAAAWDGRYRESGREIHLRKSRDLYLTVFQGDPRDYYTGINAASKSLFLGESEQAAGLASEVLPLVERADDGEDFWAGCNLGEVYLLQGEFERAAAQYQKVIDKHPAKVGGLEGTKLQAERICVARGVPEEVMKETLAPFELLSD